MDGYIVLATVAEELSGYVFVDLAHSNAADAADEAVGRGSRPGHLHSRKPAFLKVVAGSATKVVSRV